MEYYRVSSWIKMSFIGGDFNLRHPLEMHALVEFQLLFGLGLYRKSRLTKSFVSGPCLSINDEIYDLMI